MTTSCHSSCCVLLCFGSDAVALVAHPLTQPVTPSERLSRLPSSPSCFLPLILLHGCHLPPVLWACAVRLHGTTHMVLLFLTCCLEGQAFYFPQKHCHLTGTRLASSGISRHLPMLSSFSNLCTQKISFTLRYVAGLQLQRPPKSGRMCAVKLSFPLSPPSSCCIWPIVGLWSVTSLSGYNIN